LRLSAFQLREFVAEHYGRRGAHPQSLVALGGPCMKIDIFNHFFPKRYFDEYINVGASLKDLGKRVQSMPTIADLDARFRVMDEFGEYKQFLTLAAPPLEALAGPDKTPRMAEIANDGLAELCAKYPDRF